MGAGQVGGLGADERWIDGTGVVQRDDGRESGHDYTIAAVACGSLTWR